ncbi:MAG: C25 family peptidase propeptide domain-containing protein, partial [Chitinophagales bacterium]
MKNFYGRLFAISIFSLMILFVSAQIYAQNNSSQQKTSVQLISDDGNSTVLKFSFGAMKQNSVSTPNGEADIISIDGGAQILQKGFPDLPNVATSIIIPDDQQMAVTIIDSHFSQLSDITVAPSKGELLRTIDPASVAFTYDAIYNEDIFYPKNLAELQEPYILRDYRGQTVIVYPFQYNAKTKTLRVYSDITVKV